MRFALNKQMSLFAKVKGPNGHVSELNCLLDPNTPFTVLFTRDGVNLGFPEAALRPRDWQKLHPDRVVYIAGLRGIEMTTALELTEIRLGDLVARNVKTVVLEMGLPRMFPFEMILGRSFLDNFKLTLDPQKGVLKLAEPRKPTKPFK